MTTVTLTDMLLLGAPDGKTEMLGGWVDRVFVAKTPARARSIFESLARELAEQESVAWSKKKLEARNTFKVGRSRLHLEDNLVTLAVRVKFAVWEEFAGG